MGWGARRHELARGAKISPRAENSLFSPYLLCGLAQVALVHHQSTVTISPLSQADGFKSTGCSNLDCTGFIPVNDYVITPGDTLDHSSGQTKISLKIFKSKDDGDWWLYFGHDINNLGRVGYWPTSLFKNLDHATTVALGGSTVSYRGDSSPPMGNSQWPKKGSASVQNIQFLDKDGQEYIPQFPVDIRDIVTHNKCYETSTFSDDMFYYGGPGDCTE
uniref:Neprosin PEP catalytic domain-containing protein n=1 Tax=Leersia perrieri TaxID=77586 RepID=A0A0D9XQR6_9ORYZ